MRLFWLLAGLALASAPAAAEPWQLDRSDVLSVQAADGQAYRVMVAWPDTPPPAGGWPVLWVLDGEDNFVAAAQTARRLARARERTGVLPGLIVAVEAGPLDRRTRDYTPSVAGYAIPPGLPAAGRPIGGGDAFLAFLDRQVRPEIERRWQTDPARHVLVGHSFGALIAMHSIFVPSRFAGVVAISPSLWYGNGLLAREAEALAGPRPGGPRFALVAMGDESGPPGHSAAAAEALVERLNRARVRARFLPLPRLGHGSTFLASLGEAVDLAFDPAEHP